MLVATDANTLVNLPVGTNIETLVVDSVQTEGVVWLDKRITSIWESTVNNTLFNATPIPVDTSHDPAGNLNGAISSDTWQVNAGTYEIMPGAGFPCYNNSGTQVGQYQVVLYDSNAGANVQDTDGNDVKTISAPLQISGENSSPWIGQEVVFDGTEVLQFAQVIVTGTLTSNNVRSGISGSSNRGYGISFRRIK